MNNKYGAGPAAYAVIFFAAVLAVCAVRIMAASTADTTPPVISGFSPSGTVDAKKTILSVKTDENATCKVCNKDEPYETMCRQFDDTGGKTHAMDICRKRDLDVGEHKYYVRCKDGAGNINSESAKIEFTVKYEGGGGTGDTIPPVISNPKPTGTLKVSEATLSIETDENAYCKYCTRDEDYEPMCATFGETGGRVHKSKMSWLDDGPYIFYARCRDYSNNTNKSSVIIEFEINTGQSDNLPPKISDPKPSGIVTSGSVPVSVATDENATCKFDAEDKGFDSMANEFSSTGGVSHKATLNALNSQKYTIYVRCKDAAGNINKTSTKIEFEVKLDSGGGGGGGQGPAISGLQPSGTVTTAKVDLAAKTDVNAVCRYDSSDVAYDSMANEFSVTGGTDHTSPLSVLNNQKYKIYVRCKDAAGNKNGESAVTEFEVKLGGSTTDKEPPEIFNPLPQGTISVKKTEISVETGEAAVCRYSNRDLPYASMCGSFSETGGTRHSGTICPVKDFGDGTKWVFYVRCKDPSGNENTSSTKIEFDIKLGGGGEADGTPPAISDIQHKVTVSQDKGTLDVTIKTDERAACKADLSDKDYDAMEKSFSSQGQSGVNHSLQMSGLGGGKHTLFIRCKDGAGNINSVSEKIEFEVNTGQSGDIQPPVVLSLAPKGKISSKKFELKAKTDERALCKYSLTDVSYDQMNNIFLKSGGKEHSATIGPLSNGSYIVYVRCEDYEGNANTTSFSTSIEIVSGGGGGGVGGKATYLWQSVESGKLGGFWYVNWYAGYQFSPRVDGSITELCGYYRGKNRVHLYDSKFKRLASATVKSSRKWNCVEISPVKVVKGEDYYVIGEFKRTPLFFRFQCCNPSLFPKTTKNFAIKWGVRQTTGLPFGQKIKKYAYINLGLVDAKLSIGGLVVDDSDDKTPPFISNVQPTNTISNDTPDLFVQTDENATCKYDLKDKEYKNMLNIFASTKGTAHVTTIGPLPDGVHAYYVRCEDAWGNSNRKGVKISFTVDSEAGDGDTEPPAISNLTPDGVVKNQTVTISCSTDEDANCKYCPNDGAYNGMCASFSTTGKKRHSAVVGPLANDDYIYYVRCRDKSGNTNTTSAKIEFEVSVKSSDTTPPQVSNTVVTPASGEAGSDFSIRAAVSDNKGIKSVAARIHKTDGTIIGTITLYDDGKNGDDKAGDNVYGGRWNSTGKAEGSYVIDIIATDSSGNTVEEENGASFAIKKKEAEEGNLDGMDNDCKAIVRKGDSSKKIDVVFVPCNYGTDMATAKSDASKHAEKMFGYPPLGDYRDFFNFTFYEKTGLICGIDPCDNIYNFGKQYAQYASGCNPNIMIGIQKTTKRPDGKLGPAGCGARGVGIAFVDGGLPETTVHEASHSIFNLNDEYLYGVGGDSCSYRDMSKEFNCDNDSNCSKWKDVEGAACIKTCECSGNYRSAGNCAMNSPWTAKSFCPACSARIKDFFTRYGNNQ